MTQPIGGDAARERIAKLQTEIKALRGRTDWATTLTTAVGLLLVAAMGVYLMFGYRTIAGATEPDHLAQVAQGMLDEALPQARHALQEEVRRSAPAWAAGLSKQARESMPALRQKLESALVDSLDSTQKEVDLLTEKQIKEYCAKHREPLKRMLKELETSPNASEQSLAEVAATLDAELKTDLLLQANLLVENITSINKRLQRLIANKGLSDEEQLERQAMMAFRRVQKEEIDPSLLQLKGVGSAPDDADESTKSVRVSPAVKAGVPAPKVAEPTKK